MKHKNAGDASFKDAIANMKSLTPEQLVARKLELWSMTGPSSSWGGGKGTNLGDEHLKPGVNGEWRVGVGKGGPINFFFPASPAIGAGLNKGRDVLAEWIAPGGEIVRQTWAPGVGVHALKHGFPRG